MSFFEIGITHGKTEHNIGGLWRAAYQLGASGIYTIASRYPARQPSDTYQAWKHIPRRDFDNLQDFLLARPYDAMLVGVEISGKPLPEFVHPKRCIYLLGAEDHGLSPSELNACNQVVSIPALRQASYNVAVAGALVMYDRMTKGTK